MVYKFYRQKIHSMAMSKAPKNKREESVLCWADDIATSTILDPAIGFTTHKTGEKIENPTSKDLSFLKVQKSYYQTILREDSKIMIVQCQRYVRDNGVGAKVVAKCIITRNEVVRELCGRLENIGDNTSIEHGEKKFALIDGGYKKKPRVLLGPVSYVNHNCQSNSKLYSISKNFICIQVTKTVLPGQEITIDYGPNYFGIRNSQCLCTTCEVTCGFLGDTDSYVCRKCHLIFHYENLYIMHLESCDNNDVIINH